MVNVLTLRTLFSFCSHIKGWFSGLEFTKCLSDYQTGKILIRLLQSDLGLHCFLGLFDSQLVFKVLEHFGPYYSPSYSLSVSVFRL